MHLSGTQVLKHVYPTTGCRVYPYFRPLQLCIAFPVYVGCSWLLKLEAAASEF